MNPARAWKHAKWGRALFLLSLPLIVFMFSLLGRGDLRITKAFHDLYTLRQVIDRYREREGAPPPSLDTLAEQNLFDPRIKDPWGNKFIYHRSGNADGYELYSPGVNGIDERGAGDDVTDTSKSYSCKTYGMECPFPGARWLVLALATLALAGLLGFISSSCSALLGIVLRQRRSDSPGTNAS